MSDGLLCVPAELTSSFSAVHRLTEFGITRVGDLTGLDVIGLPVWFACRPNSRSLSQTQGKGLTSYTAQMSAVMEAIEQYFAENADKTEGCLVTSYRDIMNSRDDVAPLDRVAGCFVSMLDPDKDRLWCRGTSLASGQHKYAPYESVGLDFRVDSPWDRKAFRMSSVGLGANRTKDGAILHALLEVIENNATLLPDTLGSLSHLMNPVVFQEANGDNLDNAMKAVRDAGMDVKFVSLTAPIKIPVVAAYLSPKQEADAWFVATTFAGYACRMDAREAACAALLEAIQSRLTDIAGARDDIEPEDYERISVETPVQCSAAMSFEDVDNIWACSNDLSTAAAVQSILNALLNSGVGDIICFDLAENEEEFSVVRIIASGLEHAPDDGIVELGSQGIEALFRAAERLN